MRRTASISFPLFIRTAEAFLHSRKPVRTLADLKGLKLRTAGAWLEMAKDLGAAPVTTAGGDVYPMLERGAIDATEWGTLWENITPGFHKVAKYVIIPGVHQPTAPFELCINKEVWAKVPPADQRLVELVAKLVTFETWVKVGNEDVKALEFFRKAGNEIIELDVEVQRQTRKIGLEWAAEDREGQRRGSARCSKSQLEFEKAWGGAERWRTIKVYERHRCRAIERAQRVSAGDHVGACLLVPLVLATCYEVFARYLFGAPTIWAYEVGYTLTGAHFLLGMAFTLKNGEHIRIDIFSGKFSPRTRAIIDLVGYAVLLPLTLWLTLYLF